MSMELFQKLGDYKPDSLIVSAKVGLLTRGAKIAPKQGILMRGSLIGEAEDGLFYLAGTTEGGQIIKPTGVLTDTIDTGDETATVPTITTQYITGDFNKKALIVAENAKLEDYEAELRKLGIFMQDTI